MGVSMRGMVFAYLSWAVALGRNGDPSLGRRDDMLRTVAGYRRKGTPSHM